MWFCFREIMVGASNPNPFGIPLWAKWGNVVITFGRTVITFERSISTVCLFCIFMIRLVWIIGIVFMDKKGWQHEAFVPFGQVPFLFLDAVSVNRLQRLMTVTYLCLSACGWSCSYSWMMFIGSWCIKDFSDFSINRWCKVMKEDILCWIWNLWESMGRRSRRI